jgi:long-chain fatty acid transport protein
MKRIAIWLAAAAAACPTAAFAGGFEFPANGTEALGRGGAFTAKADDATALEYNVAGLARQRGTRVMFDSNLVFNSMSFQRLGTYPDSTGMMGGQRFPTISNSAGVFYAPFIGVSTDFGRLDRWTFALGVYGPSSVGKRTYPTTVTLDNGVMAPSPQRYDVTSTDLLIAYPTLAAAFRATRWFDVGVELQLAYATFDLSNVSLLYLSPNLCISLEDSNCDGFTRIQTSSVQIIPPSLGLMFHPTKFLDVGVNVRPQFEVDSTGTAHANSPKALSGLANPSGAAEFRTKMPWIVRLGVRYAIKGYDNFEHGDVELDGTYESWHQAEGDGDKVIIPDIPPISDLHPTITHHYRDTFSARLGGAYNLRLGRAGVLTFRAGGFFDSSATHYKDTRADFDTMAKWGGTGGLGYCIRGVALNVAYAFIWEPDRNVTNGDIQSINGILNGDPRVGSGPTPVINNGQYHAQNQIVSIGLTIAWEDLLGRKRVIRWQ